MWKTILVPHDFSAGAGQAAQLAHDLAKVHGAKLVFLHVAELPPLLGAGAAIVPEEGGAPISVGDYAVRSAGERLAELSAEYGKDGVAASYEAVIGHPAAEIVTVAEKLGADVIVMGTHGRAGIARALLGSVASRVVRHAKVPVVTVRIED
ncbi:MAG TPA: universal stress protein [Kofleriaceae bacterium]|nr:universal stress protein [Kofleriaceae bacterium]